MQPDKMQVQTAVAGAKHRIGHKLGDVWWAFLVRGVLAVGLGIVALFWPKATLVLLVRLVGVYALFDGIVGLIGAFRARELGAYLLPGLISVAVGVVLLVWPDVTGRWLLIILGAWALLHGLMLFLAGRQIDLNDPDRGLAIAGGAAGAVIGVILIFWPGTGAVAISWTIAVVALLVGALFIFLGLRLRQVERRVHDLSRPG